MELFVEARRERLFDRLTHQQRQVNRRKVLQIRRYLHDKYLVVCYPFQDSFDALTIEEVHLDRGHVLANDSLVIDNLDIVAIQPGKENDNVD